MPRLADEHPVARPHDLGRLVEHGLHEPRVLAVLRREGPSALAGLDLLEQPHPALGLRDDLVRDHQHVAVREIGRSGLREEGGEVVARPDVGKRGERAGEEGHGRGG